MIVTVTDLTVQGISIDSGNLRELVKQIIQVTNIVFAILSILVGWFLIKAKRWSYVLGLILVILTLAMHVQTLTQVGTTRWYGLALSSAIFILLIVGRRDFKK